MNLGHDGRLTGSTTSAGTPVRTVSMFMSPCKCRSFDAEG